VGFAEFGAVGAEAVLPAQEFVEALGEFVGPERVEAGDVDRLGLARAARRFEQRDLLL
jgi:hypothetical protein